MAGAIIDQVSDTWNTPQWIVDKVHNTFLEINGKAIELDPCSNEHSLVKATRRIMLPEDGLAAPWIGNVFCNPPYGRDTERGTSIGDWTRKARLSLDANTMLLIPAATETEHWQYHVFPVASAICFLSPRVKFLLNGEERAGSTKGSAMVYYGVNPRTFKAIWGTNGYTIVLTH